ncbi:MAG: hypothetical protein JRE23_12515 [Deltaproteobacteria bacterium]|nr:hypothetical protein [Deltaproteobacteria bacterium]
MSEILKMIDELSSDWSKEEWLKKKNSLKDCIWAEGALIKHENDNLVYFVPYPTKIGVFYEVKKEAIVDVVETGKNIEALDRSYREVRIYLKRDELLIKVQWRLAADLPNDINLLSRFASSLGNLKSEISAIDASVISNFSPMEVSQIRQDTKQGGGEKVTETATGSGTGGGSGGGSGGGTVSDGIRG